MAFILKKYASPAVELLGLVSVEIIANSPFSGDTGSGLDYNDGNLGESPIFDPDVIDLG